MPSIIDSSLSERLQHYHTFKSFQYDFPTVISFGSWQFWSPVTNTRLKVNAVVMFTEANAFVAIKLSVPEHFWIPTNKWKTNGAGMGSQGLLKVNILTMLLYTSWVEGTGSSKPLTHMKPVGHIIHTVQLTLSADTPGGVLLTTGLQTSPPIHQMCSPRK